MHFPGGAHSRVIHSKFLALAILIFAFATTSIEAGVCNLPGPNDYVAPQNPGGSLNPPRYPNSEFHPIFKHCYNYVGIKLGVERSRAIQCGRDAVRWSQNACTNINAIQVIEGSNYEGQYTPCVYCVRRRQENGSIGQPAVNGGSGDRITGSPDEAADQRMDPIVVTATTWCRGIGNPSGCTNTLARQAALRYCEGVETPGEALRKVGCNVPAICREENFTAQSCTLANLASGRAVVSTDPARQRETPVTPSEEGGEGADTSPGQVTMGPYCQRIGGTPGSCTEADAQQFVQEACRQTVTEARAIAGTCTLATQCRDRGISTDQCNPGNVVTAARRSNSGSQTEEQQRQVSVRACQEAHDKARDCCEDPVSCLTNGAMSKNNAQGIEMLAQSVMGQLGNQNNIAQICQSQETLAYTSAAVNALSARSCETKRNFCQQQCGNLIRTAEAQTVGTASAQRNQNANSPVARLREYKENCDGFAESTAASTAEVASNVNQVMQARLCRENAEGQASALGTFDAFNPDCSNPANASNPLCDTMNLCSQPGMANNPLCGSAESGGGGNVTSNPLGDGGSDTQAYLPDASSLASQDPAYGAPGGEGISNGGVPNNGGGFSPNGGNSTGNMGAGGRGGGGGGSQGKNTDIMQGFRGGGGYSTSGVGTESRGGGGGSGRSGGGFGAMSLMDLKKLLPGFDKSPTRAIAGMGTGARGASDLGLAHEDIFTKMTRAVARQCIQVRLADCSVNAGKGN